MKKMINGKVYDTEKSVEIHCWRRTMSGSYNYGEHLWEPGCYTIKETLWKTSKGNYFLVARGDIESVKPQKALEWLSKHAWNKATMEFSELIEEA